MIKYIAGGLSRIYEHTTEEFAIISAYLAINDMSTNKKAATDLKSQVRALEYGYIEMSSQWYNPRTKEYEVEYPLFIPLIASDDAINLGKSFKQEAIIYGGNYKGTDGIRIIDTLNNVGQILTTFKHTEFGIRDAWDSYTTYKGRSFSFRSSHNNFDEILIPFTKRAWDIAAKKYVLKHAANGKVGFEFQATRENKIAKERNNDALETMLDAPAMSIFDYYYDSVMRGNLTNTVLSVYVEDSFYVEDGGNEIYIPTLSARINVPTGKTALCTIDLNKFLDLCDKYKIYDLESYTEEELKYLSGFTYNRDIDLTAFLNIYAVGWIKRGNKYYGKLDYDVYTPKLQSYEYKIRDDIIDYAIGVIGDNVNF